MRMGELAEASGLSIPTIKYYLREGLLHSGHRTEVNQAIYDSSHLERLRLIRALATVAGLPLAKIRDVVSAVSDEVTVIDAMAVTQDALVTANGGGQDPAPESASEMLEGQLAAAGWNYQKGSPAHLAAVRAVADLQAEGLDPLLDLLDGYLRSAFEVGRLDVSALESTRGLEAMVRTVVLGSVLRRPLLESLVLLAQQHHGSQLNRDLGGRAPGRRPE